MKQDIPNVQRWPPRSQDQRLHLFLSRIDCVNTHYVQWFFKNIDYQLSIREVTSNQK